MVMAAILRVLALIAKVATIARNEDGYGKSKQCNPPCYYRVYGTAVGIFTFLI
jgi:hypothetical protein